MNSTFYFNRFLKLVKTESLINKSTIIKILLTLVGVMLMFYLGNNPFSITDLDNVNVVANTVYNECRLFLFLAIILAPLALFSNLYHKEKNVNYAMLPASQLEKVISALIQTSILTPALLVSVFVLFILVFRLISFPHLEVFQLEFKDVFTVIQYQSLLFLGMFWFKNNKILKITLTGIAVLVLFVTVFITILDVSSLTIKDGEVTLWIGETIFQNSIIDFFYSEGKIILAILFPLLPWLIAFWKFKRTQI